MGNIRTWILIATLAGLAGSTLATTGTVVSTIASGSYTYVELDLGGSNVWYAVPSTELEEGTQVVVPDGMPMQDFYSKTLNRTFELVYFANGICKAGTGPETSNHPSGHPLIATGLPAGHPTVQGSLPPGHPPICTSTNTASTNNACCPLQVPDTGCGSTNNDAQ